MRLIAIKHYINGWGDCIVQGQHYTSIGYKSRLAGDFYEILNEQGNITLYPIYLFRAVKDHRNDVLRDLLEC